LYVKVKRLYILIKQQIDVYLKNAPVHSLISDEANFMTFTFSNFIYNKLLKHKQFVNAENWPLTTTQFSAKSDTTFSNSNKHESIRKVDRQ
jgi:hypothetical protein